jgi:uncharacterized OB-fold protein
MQRGSQIRLSGYGDLKMAPVVIAVVRLEVIAAFG